MAPHGKRRSRGLFNPLLTSFPILTLFILPFLLSLVCFPAPASAIGSAVLGIDLGTEYLKAALVKPGIPLEIVLTKDSKRKESAAVAFKPAREANASFPERFYGGDALALAPRFPDDVYANLKVLLGIPFNGGENDIVKMYSSRYPAVKLESAPGERGTVGLRSGRLGEAEGKDAFLVEELLAMQLKQLKANAEAMAGKGFSIRDAVITYPAFYTAEEKRSVQLAAELAGLNVQALISDGLAVGLNYATSRTFPSVSEGQKPEYHVVYDMGAGSTTATVLRFQSRTVKDVGRFNKTVQEVHVLGTGWDKTLGGDALNQLIVDDMVEKFAEQRKLNAADIKAHGRTMAKLWRDAEKVRQILSANTETATSFEGLFEEDLNFKYTITRSAFEQLAKEHADRVTAPLQQALDAAGLKLSDIESVILHGGAVRTPFVQRQLEEACKDASQLRTSVNADEAAVFGAAFKAAALSPSFRVKDIRGADAASYAVFMKWPSDGKERQQKLFTPTSQIGAEKQVTVKNLEDFGFSFYQQVAKDNDLVDAPVLSVETKNLTASVQQLKDKFGCAPANITTKFSIRLSPLDGLPEVLSGSVSCEVENVEKKGSVVDDVKGFFGLGSKKGEQQQPLKADDEPSESVTSQAEGETSSTPTATSSETSTSTTSVQETKKATPEPKTKLVTIPVSLTSTPLGTPPPSPDEMRRIKDRLAAFDASDRERVLREEAMNELESFIYRGRDLVEDEEFLKAIKKDQLAVLNEQLAAASDWLYGEGAEAKTKEFKDRLKSLKDIVDPAVRRKNENSLRPTRMTLLEEMLKSAKSISEVMEKQIRSDEEAFSSSLAASSSSSATSSSDSNTEASGTSTTTASPSPTESASSTDGFADLDDDPYSTSSSATSTSSTTTTAAAPSKPASPTYSVFTPADLSSLTRVYESVNTWYEKQRALQEKLTESDDPALTVSEIDSRLGELERVLSRLTGKLGAGFGPEQGDEKAQSSKKSGKNGKNGKKAEKAKKDKKPEEKQKEKEKKNETEKPKPSNRKDEL
ncbi:putative Hsp70 family chaperone Lhs1/Orp150 [Thermoascus aurantiacus ATCC 26904]